MRVLIVDDHPFLRTGLRALLETRDITVVGEATNGREAVELAEAERPDVVLMDLDMPVMGGLDATRAISAEMPEVKVVVLTASEEDADLFEAIKAGARGYMYKNLEAKRFFELLERVERGEPALTPGLASKVLKEFASPTRREDRHPDALSEREQQILELLVQGITSNREIAERLILSENTIKYHLRNILDKLHLQNRAQVVAYALRHGLVKESGQG